MSDLYYTAPSDEIFEEVKQQAIKVWQRYEFASPDYSTEKIDRIKDLENVSDNMMYIVAMFDIYNQRYLAAILNDDAKTSIANRLIVGGMPKEFNPFI